VVFWDRLYIIVGMGKFGTGPSLSSPPLWKGGRDFLEVIVHLNFRDKDETINNEYAMVAESCAAPIPFLRLPFLTSPCRYFSQFLIIRLSSPLPTSKYLSLTLPCSNCLIQVCVVLSWRPKTLLHNLAVTRTLAASVSVIRRQQ